MRLYHYLSEINFLKKSYTGKFFFVAFLGIHIPLIGLILLLLFHPDTFSSQIILIFTLLFTLLATSVTLFVIKKLMVPINSVNKALHDYRQHRKVPKLPLKYHDEAGQLLYNIQETINDNENYLTQKQDLIYLLTHDIKNYASQPKAIAEWIVEEEGCTDSIKEFTEMIVSSSDKQIEFLESFIHLLRDEEDLSRMEITPRKVNFEIITKEIQEQLESKLAEKNITLTTKINTKPANLLIDEILLSRIVFNLVHNAVKFSYPDSHIILTAHFNKGFLEVIVEDTGMGFKNSNKDFLFSKFSNMGRKGTSNEKSTGIGLYLCRQIVKKFDGYIDAYSAGENNGATFTVGFKIID